MGTAKAPRKDCRAFSSPDMSCCCRFCMPLLSLVMYLAQSTQERFEISWVLLPNVCCRFCLPLLSFDIWLNRLRTCRNLLVPFCWRVLPLPLLSAADVLDFWLNSIPITRRFFSLVPCQTLRAVKSDVTRHRYGDEAHLDTTVKFLGLVLPQSDYPQLQYITQVRLYARA